MTDDRKINEYAFSEMSISLNNITSLAKDTQYVEGQLRVGSKVMVAVRVREEKDKVKII